MGVVRCSVGIRSNKEKEKKKMKKKSARSPSGVAPEEKKGSYSAYSASFASSSLGFILFFLSLCILFLSCDSPL